MARMTQQNKNEIALRTATDPIWFARNALGVNYWKKQREIVQSVWENRNTTVKASHGVGKTYVAANIALSYLFTKPNSIVVTTAPTTRQVEMLIWQEMRKTLSNIRMPITYDMTPASPTINPLTEGKRVPKWYATGFSTTDPDKFQGIHQPNVLIIVDEAAGVSDKILQEGIPGCLTMDTNRLLYIGNPTSVSGGFYESHKDPLFEKFTISTYDTPNFTRIGIKAEDIYNGDWKEKTDRFIAEFGGLPFPGFPSPIWAAEKYQQWCKGGVKNSLFISKVEGEFVEQDNESLLPVSWVETSFARWEDAGKLKGEISYGVDVAEFGDDESSIATRVGNTIKEIKNYKEVAVMDLAGIVAGRARAEDPEALIKIDTIGIGTGVEGRLKEEGFNTLRVAVSQKSKFIDKTNPEIMKVKDEQIRELIMDGENFANLKAQMYWYLRMRLDPDTRINPVPINLPPNGELLKELTSIKYRYTSTGKIQIEPKKETKKKIGRSPDMADAVAIAFCPVDIVKAKETPIPRARILTLG